MSGMSFISIARALVGEEFFPPHRAPTQIFLFFSFRLRGTVFISTASNNSCPEFLLDFCCFVLRAGRFVCTVSMGTPRAGLRKRALLRGRQYSGFFFFFFSADFRHHVIHHQPFAYGRITFVVPVLPQFREDVPRSLAELKKMNPKTSTTLPRALTSVSVNRHFVLPCSCS
jgi:hypothetical protein